MINHDKKFYFIRVPKTGSRAIAEKLETKFMTHTRNQVIKKKYKVSSYFSFAFVRNPYRRLYSAWNYLKNGGLGTQNDRCRKVFFIDSTGGSFEKFVLRFFQEDIDTLKKISHCPVDPVHFYPQIYWTGEKNNLDYIGSFEDINSCWTIISKKLKLDPNLQIKNSSNTKYKNILDIYTPEMLKIIENFYSNDFEEFDYEKIS